MIGWEILEIQRLRDSDRSFSRKEVKILKI